MLIKKISPFKTSGHVVPGNVSFCPGELCMDWASLQKPQIDHSVSVCRRSLAHPDQNAAEFWQQWHLCRVTPIVLHLSGIHHDMAGPLRRQCELTMSGC